MVVLPVVPSVLWAQEKKVLLDAQRSFGVEDHLLGYFQGYFQQTALNGLQIDPWAGVGKCPILGILDITL